MERSPHGVGPSGGLLSEEGPVWKIASNEEVFKKNFGHKKTPTEAGALMYMRCSMLYMWKS